MASQTRAARGAAGALLLGLLALWGGTAQAAGNVKAGAEKALFCATCHGLDGNATQNGVPRLAGQSATGFIAKLKRLKRGGKAGHPMMGVLTEGLTDQDVADLAAYYAAQKQAR